MIFIFSGSSACYNLKALKDGMIQEYPKAIQDRCRELGLIQESSEKSQKSNDRKAWILYCLHIAADGGAFGNGTVREINA